MGGVRPFRRVAKLRSGFVTLIIFGMAYRLWLKKSPLALGKFWITEIGSADVIVAGYLFFTSGSVALAANALDLAEMSFEGVGPAATGRPSYHPSVLLKLYIYGCLNRIQSRRRLEREAGRNVEVLQPVAKC